MKKSISAALVLGLMSLSGGAIKTSGSGFEQNAQVALALVSSKNASNFQAAMLPGGGQPKSRSLTGLCGSCWAF